MPMPRRISTTAIPNEYLKSRYLELHVSSQCKLKHIDSMIGDDYLTTGQFEMWEQKCLSTPRDTFAKQHIVILSMLPYLEELSVKCSDADVDDLVRCIVAWLPNLQSLQLAQSQLPVNLLAQLLDNCSRLQEIDIAGIVSCTSYSVQAVQDVRQVNQEKGSEDKMDKVAQSFLNHTSLKKISLKSWSAEFAMQDSAIQAIFHAITKKSVATSETLCLESLTLDEINLSYTTLINFLSCPASKNLKSFNLGFSLSVGSRHDVRVHPSSRWVTNCLRTRHRSFKEMKGDLDVISWSPELPLAFFEVVGQRIRSFKCSEVNWEANNKRDIVAAIKDGHLPHLQKLELQLDAINEMDNEIVIQIFVHQRPGEAEIRAAIERYGSSFQLVLARKVEEIL